MRNFTICFFPDSYITVNGQFKDIGEIYIQLDDYSFPDKKWTDFGKVVVSWWMEAFRKLLSGEEKKVQCKFMDGNYRFDVEATNSLQIWHVILIKELADSEEIEAEGDVYVRQATDQLLQALTEVKELYAKEGKDEYVKNAVYFIQKFFSESQKALLNAN